MERRDFDQLVLQLEMTQKMVANLELHDFLKYLFEMMELGDNATKYRRLADIVIAACIMQMAGRISELKVVPENPNATAPMREYHTGGVPGSEIIN